MKRLLTLTALLLTAAPAVAPAACGAWPSLIEAFTDSDHPIEGADILASQMPQTRIQVYRIDGKAEFDAKLSEGLPADPQAAQRMVMDRVAGIKPEEVGDSLNQALNGAMRMARYGLGRIPAVVFDGHYAVQGEADLRRALDTYCRRSSSP